MKWHQRRGGIFNCWVCGINKGGDGTHWHYHDTKIGREHWAIMQSQAASESTQKSEPVIK